MKAAIQQTEDEEPAVKVVVEKKVPPYGTVEWIQYCSEEDGHLPTPIDVSITGSIYYYCPELKWYNFDVYPHKVKLSNTGYTVLIGAKWKTERPYLEGGPFLEKHVLSQIHFHWGANLMEGSDHTVDNRQHPGEMQTLGIRRNVPASFAYCLGTQDNMVLFSTYSKKGEGSLFGVTARSLEKMCPVDGNRLAPYYVGLKHSWRKVTFFRSEYLTQAEAIKHPDGVVMICYLIKYGVLEDERLSWVLEGFPRIKEAQTHTRIGPLPMSRLLPMFFEDYFLYWGKLDTSKGESYVIRWLISRSTLFATADQMKEFRTLWNPWDEPLERNFRPLQERGDRRVFFISPHWAQYNSLLPIPRIPEESISVLSPAYQNNLWMLPPQNAYMLPEPEEEIKEEAVTENEFDNII